MGLTFIKAKLTNPKDTSKSFLGEFLVDTGATYTLIPKSSVNQLGLIPKRIIELVLADGKILTRGVGEVLLEMNGQEVSTPVILGEEEESLLLGAVTLEEMGFAVNPLTRSIYPIKTFV